MNQSEIQEEHIKRLQWAISFSQTDLSAFRDGDWSNAKQDLWEFMRGKEARPPEKQYSGTPTFGSNTPFGEWFNWQAKPGKLAHVHDALKEQLQALAYDHQKRPDNMPVEARPIKGVNITVLGSTPDLPFKQSISKSADLAVQAEAALFEHLVSSGILRGKLRVCPDCTHIFLHKKKPRADVTFHCSTRCARLAATRAYRERQPTEKEGVIKANDRERSHQRYVKKQQKKLGPKVKVARRLRKARGA